MSDSWLAKLQLLREKESWPRRRRARRAGLSGELGARGWSLLRAFD
jgi:hypothetical protein